MNKTLKTVLIVGGALLIAGAALFAAAVLMGGSPKNILESEKGSYITGGVSVNVTGDGVNVTVPGGDVPSQEWTEFSKLFSGEGWSELGNVYSETGEYSCPASTDDVDIEWISGSVRVEPYDGDEIMLKETVQGGAAVAKEDALGWGIREGVLYIRYCGREMRSDIPAKELAVLLPRAVAEKMAKLELDTASADMSVSGITCGELAFDSASGSLTAQDCAVRKAEVNTTSGDVQLSGEILMLDVVTASGAVRAQTSKSGAAADVESVSGGVELIGFRQNEAGTAGGAVTIETPEATDIDVETVSGEVTLLLSEKAEFTLDYETVSGELSCDFATVQKGGKYICGGGGTTIEVGSTSGGLKVKYA